MNPDDTSPPPIGVIPAVIAFFLLLFIIFCAVMGAK